MDYRVADHEDPVVWTWTDVSLALIVGGLSNSYLEFDLWKTTQMEWKTSLVAHGQTYGCTDVKSEIQLANMEIFGLVSRSFEWM